MHEETMKNSLYLLSEMYYFKFEEYLRKFSFFGGLIFGGGLFSEGLVGQQVTYICQKIHH